MFLLGHSCWSYLFSKSSAQQLKISMPTYLAFLSGVLPDFDIYFQPLGLIHHTYTHSLLIIIPLVALLTYFLGRFGFAISIGIMSHLLGDSIVGTIPILYPVFPEYVVGLNLGIPSLPDTVLEMGAFLLVIVYSQRNGDYKLVLKPSRAGLLLGIPLFAIDTLTVLFAGDRNISLAAFAFSRRALTLITVGHIALSGILAVGAVQGIVWYGRTRARRFSSSDSAGSPASTHLL